MSIARHHNEWLSLLDVSGSYLSMPVLMRALPQGLDAHDPAVARNVRAAHEEWEDAVALARTPDPAILSALVQIRAYSPVRRRFLPWTLGRVGLES